MAARCLVSIFFLMAAVLASSGCMVAVQPIEVAADCPDQPLRGPDEFTAEPADQLIDDFETGDLHLTKVGGRTGSWVYGDDDSPSGMVTAEDSSRCAARGARAGHFAGAGFTNWGANWTAVFLDLGGGTVALPYDGRAYTGISFWAAVGSGALEPFEAPVGLTTLDVAWNGGVCTTKCMDYYGTKVPLTRAWQRVVIRFADLAQAGWGVPQVAMRNDQLVGFIVWPNHQFDIWIDDVRFEP
jgi:hypothetical protein